MNVFRSRAAVLALQSARKQTGEYEYRCAAAGGIVHCGSESLGANIDVHYNALGLVRLASVAVRHRKSDHLTLMLAGIAYGVAGLESSYTLLGQVMKVGNCPFFSL